MLALVDSDTPIFSTALVSEDVDLSIAKSRLDYNINHILEARGCSEYKLFVSGEGNFRKEIDPSYKLHRADKPHPKWRESLRLHLIESWGAIECNGYEADDACGIHQCSDGSTIICGIDKDLLQIPGKHYQWPILRKGKIVRPSMHHDIDEETGWRNLFTQALVGDAADDIKGIPGIGPAKAAKILEDCHTEEEMYDKVRFFYSSSLMVENATVGEQRLKTNLDLLYIWREPGVTYSIRREINGLCSKRIFECYKQHGG